MHMCRIQRDSAPEGTPSSPLLGRVTLGVLGIERVSELLLKHWNTKFLSHIDVAIATLQGVEEELKRMEEANKNNNNNTGNAITKKPPQAEKDDEKDDEKKDARVGEEGVFLNNVLSLLIEMSKNSRVDASLRFFSSHPSSSSSGGPAKKNKKRRRREEELGIEGQLETFSSYSKQLSRTWLALFQHRLPEDGYRHALKEMKEVILPKISQPILLFDFLKESYDIGGVVSLLALEGLFILIIKHNLDYPDFYPKLYSLLTLRNLQASHRHKFFHLVGLFLKSPKLPSYMLAAFAKRLCRICLKADPGVITWSLALVFNMMKRNPQIECLVNRIPKDGGALAFLDMKAFGPDPYREDEPDMAKCKAMDSCLWEIKTLSNHYSPKVVTLARNFTDENAPKLPIEMTQNLNDCYSSLYETELAYRKNQKPAIRYQPQSSLAVAGDDLCDFYQGVLPAAAE
mmetsp:Transcript_14659/g.29679  ORF Transcript_14659/g.29679 Transcript_14659/m.29679 type:complete len:457 (-) Transcript_14659:374-1744(-)